MLYCHNHKVSLLNLFLSNLLDLLEQKVAQEAPRCIKIMIHTTYFMYRSFFFCIYHAKFCHITQKKEAIAIYRNFGIGSLAQGLYGHNHLLI